MSLSSVKPRLSAERTSIIDHYFTDIYAFLLFYYYCFTECTNRKKKLIEMGLAVMSSDEASAD